MTIKLLLSKIRRIDFEKYGPLFALAILFIISADRKSVV